MIRRQWLDLVGLALVVCAVYGNSLSGSFHYDDFHSLVQNVHVRDLQRIPDFFLDPSLFSVDPDKAMYRPLLLVSMRSTTRWAVMRSSAITSSIYSSIWLACCCYGR